MTTYIYELCGPLVDDTTVTRDAYRHAASMLGQIPPHLKDGYTDSQCGVDSVTYNRRTAAYRARACDVRTGWAADHFKEKVALFSEDIDIYLFTSHQGDTAQILWNQPHLYYLDRAPVKLYRMDPTDRIHRLRKIAERGPAVYVCAPWWHNYMMKTSDGPAGVTYVPSAEALAWLDKKEIEND